MDHLPVKTDIPVENFAAKCRQLVRLCGTIRQPLGYKLAQMEREEVRGDNSSESGDEVIPDLAIQAAFPADEWNAILEKFEDVKENYLIAKQHSFENHGGKVFMQAFMRFCCCMRPAMEKAVNISTASSGEHQPGCTRFIKRTVRSQPSSNRSTPGEEGDVQTCDIDEPCKRYTDVSHWAMDRYTTAVEVERDEPAEDQTTEQMFGLFRGNQNSMLGMIVKPNGLQIKFVRNFAGHVTLSTLEHDMSFLENTTFMVMAKLCIAFFYFIDC